jgi:hypothetical protein
MKISFIFHDIIEYLYKTTLRCIQINLMLYQQFLPNTNLHLLNQLMKISSNNIQNYIES